MCKTLVAKKQNPRTVLLVITIEMINNEGFGLTKIYLVKVQQWFGLSAFVVFEKGKDNIIDFERKIFQAK